MKTNPGHEDIRAEGDESKNESCLHLWNEKAVNLQNVADRHQPVEMKYLTGIGVERRSVWQAYNVNISFQEHKLLY